MQTLDPEFNSLFPFIASPFLPPFLFSMVHNMLECQLRPFPPNRHF